MKRFWIFFIAFRYFKTKRKNRGMVPSLFSVLGIAVGVMTLIAVLSVMNGFQLSFIEDILEINSFHIRIYNVRSDEKTLRQIRNISGIKSVVPFIDIQTMIQGNISSFEACLIRGVPGDISTMDENLVRQLGLGAGELIFPEERSIFLGRELANRLGVSTGDKVDLVSMAGTEFTSLKPSQEIFTVAGIFRSGYYEYDVSMAFVPLISVDLLASGLEDSTIGIKLDNRYSDRKIMQAITKTLAGSAHDVTVISWREYNRAFFGALRMEKAVMTLLLGLIFLVVGVNIRNSLERSVLEKREEISILRSLGATSQSIKSIFLLEGAIIGISGGFFGALFGLLIASNVNSLFLIVESMVNRLYYIIGALIVPFFDPGASSFSIFSPSYFYISLVPMKMIFHEVLFIVLFSIGSSIYAAYAAARRISEFKPAEVLRNE